MQIRYRSSHWIAPWVVSVFVITIEELDCPRFMSSTNYYRSLNLTYDVTTQNKGQKWFTVSGQSKQASKQASKHSHARMQWSHASVGLAQARPNNCCQYWLSWLNTCIYSIVYQNVLLCNNNYYVTTFIIPGREEFRPLALLPLFPRYSTQEVRAHVYTCGTNQHYGIYTRSTGCGHASHLLLHTL